MNTGGAAFAALGCASARVPASNSAIIVKNGNRIDCIS
jgi:hypothetical protein